jgi:hypothetical protein
MSPGELKALAEKLEAEAAKRGFPESQKRVVRIIVQPGDDEEKMVAQARAAGADLLIVRQIVGARPAELAQFPPPPGPGPEAVAARMEQEQKPPPPPKDPIVEWLEAYAKDLKPWSGPLLSPKCCYA